jgi:hypothetical protein
MCMSVGVLLLCDAIMFAAELGYVCLLLAKVQVRCL